MFGPGPATLIYLAAGVTDMRKGFEGLYGLVRDRLACEPLNWIHIGSPQAGPKAAAILSVVESCRRLKLPVRDYFAAVLPGFGDLPVRCLQELTPAVWVAQHS